MGRNWNRKTRKTHKIRAGRERTEISDIPEEKCICCEKENRHKASNRNISKQKTFPNPPKKIHLSFRAKRRTTTTQNPKL